MDVEAWNDDVMVELLHDAIRTHRTQLDDQKKRRRVEWTFPADLQPPSPSKPAAPPTSETDRPCTDAEGQDREWSVAAEEPPANYMYSQTRAALSADPGADEPLTSLLLAWYNCGYATGRYQTLMELRGQTGIATPSTETALPDSTKIDVQVDVE